MNSLDDYMHGTFVEDKRQQTLLAEIVKDVAPLFRHFWDDSKNTWPYEVRDGVSPKISSLSASTHSMILVMLNALTDPGGKTALMPFDRHPLQLTDELSQNLKTICEEARSILITKLESASSKALTTSQTFGVNDPLTLLWICQLLNWGISKDKTDFNLIKDKLKTAIDDVLRKSEKWLSWPKTELRKFSRNEYQSTFLLLRVTLLASDATRCDVCSVDSPVKLTAFQESIHRQLAYFSIPDSRFDPAELAFAMEGALQIAPAVLSETTVRRILEVLSESQNRDPYWRPVMPFVGTERGMVLYPVSVEVANSLLRSCVKINEIYGADLFTMFEPKVRRYCQWLQARLERVGNNGKRFVGWHSDNNNTHGAIHLWETSQVLLFLLNYSAMLQRKIALDGLTAARLKRRAPSKLADYWTNSEPCPGFDKNSPYLVLKQINEAFIAKQLKFGSILLYGPPGTGKTTLVEQLAEQLGFEFIVITVSDFLAGGAGEVEARAKYVFEILNEQDDCVILLDEIDQFLLDRDSDAYKNQQGIFQFMTPGMLTKLQDLQKAERSIFVIATNYADRIDSAIKRHGRIEDRWLVNLLDSKARLDRLFELVSKKLEKTIGFDRSTFVSEAINQKLDCLTVFFSRDELKYAFNKCTFSSGSNVNQIVDELVQNAARISSAVSLSSYSRRLNADILKPELVEEFFLLVVLLAEVMRQAEEIKAKDMDSLKASIQKIAGQPEPPTIDILIDKLQETISDSDILRRLKDAFTRWNICA